MADIKINGNKYNGIERVNFFGGSDDMSVVSFMDASILENLITGDFTEEYYDTQITNIKKDIFKQSNIGVINMPNVRSIAFQSFYGCKAREIRFEGLETLPQGSQFLAMSNLTKAVFGAKLQSLGDQVFNACSKLVTLVLKYNGVVTVQSSSLSNTAIAGGTGYVYVPSAQVENYKANSSWSAYANQIRAIEDYPDEVA